MDDDREHRSVGPSAADVAIWVAAFLALTGTLYASLGSPPSADTLVVSDKLAHAAVYALDTFLLLLAVVWRPGRPQALVAWLVPIVLGVALLGGAMELAQAAVSRDAELLDWVADLVGIGVAVLAFTLLRRRFGAAGGRPGPTEGRANQPARGA